MAVTPLGSITNTYAHYVCGDADGSWYEASNWECQWNELWGCPCYYNVETGEMVWTLSETGAEVRRGGSSWVLPSDAACPDLTISHHAPLAAEEQSPEEQSPEEQPWDWEQHWSEQFNCCLYYDTKTKDLRFSPNDPGPPSLEDVAREVFGALVEPASDSVAEHDADSGSAELGLSEESEAPTTAAPAASSVGAAVVASTAATAEEVTALDVAATADLAAGTAEVEAQNWQGCDSKPEVADTAAAAANAAAAAAAAVAAAAAAAAAAATAPAMATANTAATVENVTAAAAAAATAAAATASAATATASAEATAESGAAAAEEPAEALFQARTAESIQGQQCPAPEPEAPETATAAEEPAEAASQARTPESTQSQQGPAPEPEALEGATPPGRDQDARQRPSEDEVAEAPRAATATDVTATMEEGSQQEVSETAVAGAARVQELAPAAGAGRSVGGGGLEQGAEACVPHEIMQRFGAELERRRKDCERLRKVVMELAQKDKKMEVRAMKVNRIMEELRQHANKRVEKVTQDMEELRLQHSAELAELRAEVRRFRHKNAELRQGSGKVSSPRKIISSIPRPLVNSSPRVPKRNGSLPRKGTVPSLVSSFSSVATAATKVLGVPAEAPSQPVGGRPSMRRSTGGEAGRSNGW